MNNKKEVALYIHIPFCRQKCLYCDFVSFAGVDKYMEEYVDALIIELRKVSREYRFKSLFIGGGTPSHLDERSLAKLMCVIKNLDFIEGAEKTIECNPGTVDEAKFKIISDGGINRLSFGLQSTKNEILKKIGRIHSYEQFKENYLLARKIGFSNINIDMMFGLPNQSLQDWIESLGEVISLEPEHISVYSLIIEEGTQFYNMYNNNLIMLPSEEEEREMHAIAQRILISNEYYQYEISNFSKKNRECYHNKVYWKCEEYIGVGVNASSYVDNKRWKNISIITEYIDNICKNKCIIEEEYVNTNNDNIEEFMFMNLRMNVGINETEFQNRFNISIDSIYKNQIDKHIKSGLLMRENNRIFLTDRGRELSNSVMSDFILE